MITRERVEMREAMLSAASFIYRDPDNKEPINDVFKISQLSIAYKHERPLSDYAKRIRTEAKKKRLNNVHKVTTKT